MTAQQTVDYLTRQSLRHQQLPDQDAYRRMAEMVLGVSYAAVVDADHAAALGEDRARAAQLTFAGFGTTLTLPADVRENEQEYEALRAGWPEALHAGGVAS